MEDSALKTIGYVAKRTGATVSALRFYADENLIPTVRFYFNFAKLRLLAGSD